MIWAKVPFSLIKTAHLEAEHTHSSSRVYTYGVSSLHRGLLIRIFQCLVNEGSKPQHASVLAMPTTAVSTYVRGTRVSRTYHMHQHCDKE
jgi:hypothetical protein